MRPAPSRGWVDAKGERDARRLRRDIVGGLVLASGCEPVTPSSGGTTPGDDPTGKRGAIRQGWRTITGAEQFLAPKTAPFEGRLPGGTSRFGGPSR